MIFVKLADIGFLFNQYHTRWINCKWLKFWYQNHQYLKKSLEDDYEAVDSNKHLYHYSTPISLVEPLQCTCAHFVYAYFKYWYLKKKATLESVKSPILWSTALHPSFFQKSWHTSSESAIPRFCVEGLPKILDFD